jgi:hypothetical protein
VYEGDASTPAQSPSPQAGKVERRIVGTPAGPTRASRPEREYRPDRSWDRLLLVVGALVVVAALLIVPGLLNRGGQNPVAAAAEATSDVPGVRIDFTGSSQGADQASFSGRGVMNGETDQASIQMSATGSTASGTQRFTLDEIVDGGDLYMHSPQLGGALGSSAPWMLVRSEVFGDLLQGDASGAGMSNSPTQQLDALKDASYQVAEVGPERVNGVETTHYKALIDTDKLADHLKSEVTGELGDLIEKSMDQVSSATVDVWIDPDGLLRRETSTSIMGSLGSFTTTMDFSHYGIRPNIRIPSGPEVYDATPLMERALDALSS